MTTTLHDQIGVMGIIDNLRHEKLKLSELLSFDEQREAIKKRIEDYYKAQGIEVDREIIDEGIRVWFADRLTVQTIVPTRFESLYINRSHWMNKVRNGLAISMCAFAVWFCVNYAVEDYQQYQFQSLVSKYQLLAKEFDDVTQDVVSHQENNPSQSNPALDALINAHSNHLKDVIALSVALKNDVQAIDNMIATQNLDNDYQSLMVEFSSKMNAYSQEHYNLNRDHKNISEVQSISLQAEQFKEKFKSLYAQYPALSQASASLQQLLELEGSSHEKIKYSFESLQEKITLASEASQKLRKAESLKAHLLSFNLPARQHQKVEQLFSEIGESIIAFDKDTDIKIQQLESLSSIVALNLHLVVNPDGKGKTGVERTYEGSGGKSWYIIAGAVKPSGDIIDLFVKNRETGKLEKSSKFGIKVTQTKYKAVGNDKKDDGVVNDNLLATKLAGSIEFSPTNDVELEYVTRW